MIKVLIVAPDTKEIDKIFADNTEIKKIHVNIKELNEQLQTNKHDYIFISNEDLVNFVNKDSVHRQQIKAVTHQGIRLVDIENIYYFQAEHKYVNAIHTEGELLIEDSLNSLEDELADIFVRIHRKTLVAKKYIEEMQKNPDGQYMVKIKGQPQTLLVSRRQVAALRKVLLSL